MARKEKARKTGGKEPPGKDEGVHEIPGHVSLERSPFRLRGNVSYLSTDMDSLYSYVKQQGSVKLSTAARKFKAKRELIEEWGRMLEDHHMLELHYPVAGEPTLRAPETGKDKGKKSQKAKETEKTGGKPKRHRVKLTKKRLFVTAEIVVLGTLLIYIFIVNARLRDNLIPTVSYQIANLPGHLTDLLSQLSGRMVINPIYFLIGVIIVIFWIAATLMQRRKKKSYVRDWRKRHRKP